jgi:hypothetical protein
MPDPQPHPALARKRATDATLARYRGRLFDWKKGATCLHLAAFHLRAMGHKVPALPRVRGIIGARRALDAHGWPTVAEMIDAQGLPRIAAAAMLPGDLAFRRSVDGLGGLLVCVGPHKLAGWFPENTRAELGADVLVVMDMSFDQVEACWRI